ncbi:MAG: hypothetical protein HYZ28_13715 [Myxococcales bacterium]|nr:hypothetical protein [Myxococcales bacterium]
MRWKRLPLLLVALVGLWLWKGGGGLFPTGRELVYELPIDSTIREVEIQLWDGEELLKREAISFADGPAPSVVQKLPLKEGEYLARVFIRRRDAGSPEAFSRKVHVGDAETVVTSLR